MAPMKLEPSDFRTTLRAMETNLKTLRNSRSIGMVLAILSLATLSGQSMEFSHVHAKNNSAVAMTPRAQEAFPHLGRANVERPQRTTSATPNHAFNASPRAQEDFVELARPSRPSTTSADLARRTISTPIAANPRALEDHPELARQVLPAAVQPTFQVAPVK